MPHSEQQHRVCAGTSTTATRQSLQSVLGTEGGEAHQNSFCRRFEGASVLLQRECDRLPLITVWAEHITELSKQVRVPDPFCSGSKVLPRARSLQNFVYTVKTQASACCCELKARTGSNPIFMSHDSPQALHKQTEAPEGRAQLSLIVDYFVEGNLQAHCYDSLCELFGWAVLSLDCRGSHLRISLQK